MLRKINPFEYVEWDVYEQNEFGEEEEPPSSYLSVSIPGLLFDDAPGLPFDDTLGLFSELPSEQLSKDIPPERSFEDIPPERFFEDLLRFSSGELLRLSFENVFEQSSNIFMKNIIGDTG